MFREDFQIDLEDIKIPSYVKSKEDCKPNISNWLWETFQLGFATHPECIAIMIYQLHGYKYPKDVEAIKKFIELEKSLFERDN